MTVVEFDPPERFVLGTVGPPGQRTFFLQASDESRRVQVSLEKLHAQVLAERIGELLDQVAGLEATVAAARARGYDPGDVSDLSRRTPDGTLLQWRLTRGENRRLDVPFLIDWGATAQPGLGDIPTIELVSFVRVEPDPEPLQRVLNAYGLGDGAAEVVAAAPGEAAGFRLTLRTADGAVVEL